MKNGNIKEYKNKELAEYAVKFHGMKKGSVVEVRGSIGTVIDYNFKGIHKYIDVYVEARGFNSQYAPHNVKMVSNL